MLNSSSAAGLTMRPSRPTDAPFMYSLYQSARPELQLIDAEPEVVAQVVAQQYQVQERGIGDNFPDAIHYVVEKLDTPIGLLSADFGPNEIRVLYLAFVPAARGKGYGRSVLQGVQKAAEQVRCPVATVVWTNNSHARRHYLALGFAVEECTPTAERLVWYPQG